MPEPNTDTAAVFQPGDPRPIFDGDWARASGHERQAHMTLIAKWKQAQPEGTAPSAKPRAPSGGAQRGSAQSRIGAGDEGHAPHGGTADAAGLSPSRDADDLARLQVLIDSSSTLPSDVIRAVAEAQRIAARIQQQEREREHGPLIDLRAALETIPPHERMAALSSLLRVEA